MKRKALNKMKNSSTHPSLSFDIFVRPFVFNFIRIKLSSTFYKIRKEMEKQFIVWK